MNNNIHHKYWSTKAPRPVIRKTDDAERELAKHIKEVPSIDLAKILKAMPEFARLIGKKLAERRNISILGCDCWIAIAAYLHVAEICNLVSCSRFLHESITMIRDYLLVLPTQHLMVNRNLLPVIKRRFVVSRVCVQRIEDLEYFDNSIIEEVSLIVGKHTWMTPSSVFTEKQSPRKLTLRRVDLPMLPVSLYIKHLRFGLNLDNVQHLTIIGGDSVSQLSSTRPFKYVVSVNIFNETIYLWPQLVNLTLILHMDIPGVTFTDTDMVVDQKQADEFAKDIITNRFIGPKSVTIIDFDPDHSTVVTVVCRYNLPALVTLDRKSRLLQNGCFAR